MPNIAALITVAAVMFAVLGAITLIAHIYSLNNIKSKTVGGGQAQHDSPKNEPQRTPPKGEKRGGKPIRTSPPKKETAPDMTEAEIIKDLTKTEVQSNEPS